MKSLRQVRKDKGLRLIDIEESLGIHISFLSEIERGLRNPSKLTRQRLELYFGQRINWLEVSELKTSPKFQTNWDSVDHDFRSLVRAISGLPEEEKIEFLTTIINHLRKMKNAALLPSM